VIKALDTAGTHKHQLLSRAAQLDGAWQHEATGELADPLSLVLTPERLDSVIVVGDSRADVTRRPAGGETEGGGRAGRPALRSHFLGHLPAGPRVAACVRKELPPSRFRGGP
jgi:hypothetical protein